VPGKSNTRKSPGPNGVQGNHSRCVVTVGSRRDDFLKCEIAGIESELSAGHPIPAPFIRGSIWGPKLGLFALLSGVSLV
jgi:hypothetical protein